VNVRRYTCGTGEVQTNDPIGLPPAAARIGTSKSVMAAILIYVVMIETEEWFAGNAETVILPVRHREAGPRQLPEASSCTIYNHTEGSGQ